MTDAELIGFATEFRDGLLHGSSSSGMCAVVSWPLAGLLRAYGVECECVESDLGHGNHIWIRLADGRVLDPTADQFHWMSGAKNLPAVYLGPPEVIHIDPVVNE